MSIDADLNAGVINEEQARNRRKNFSRKQTFMEPWMEPPSS